MKTHLHKLPEGFIITSDDDLAENILCYDVKLGLFISSHNFNSYNTNLCKRVIAQQDQIDFSSLSEEEQKKISWFDVEKLAEDYSRKEWEDLYSTKGITGSERGWETKDDFKAGFQKTQELLSDRRFTLEEVELIFGLGAANHANGKPSFEEVIQSLSQPKSWKVECIEENGKIKILRIL